MSIEEKAIDGLISVVKGLSDALYKFSKIHPMIAFGNMQLMANIAHATLLPDSVFPGSVFGKKIATRQHAYAEAFMITGAKFGDLLTADAIKGITPLVTGVIGSVPTTIKELKGLKG